MAADDHHETVQRKHELERRSASYARLKRHFLGAVSSLDQQLAHRHITLAKHTEKLDALLGGASREEKLAYYDGIIRSCAEEMQQLERSSSSSSPAAIPISRQVHLSTKMPQIMIVAALLLIVAALLFIPNRGALRGLAVYERTVINVPVNIFVPSGSAITYATGSNSTLSTVEELAAQLGLDPITSVYDHRLTQGYYFENITVDVTSLGLGNPDELTITITINDSNIFMTTVSPRSFMPAELPEEGGPSKLLRLNWSFGEDASAPAPMGGNASMEGNGSLAPNESVAPSPDVVLDATSADAFNASIRKAVYAVGETVSLAIIPNDVNYSIVVIGPGDSRQAMDGLNFTPVLPGNYTMNVLLYTDERSERFSLHVIVFDPLAVLPIAGSPTTMTAASGIIALTGKTGPAMAGETIASSFDRVRLADPTLPAGWYLQQSGTSDSDEACLEEHSWSMSTEGYAGTAVAYHPAKDTLNCGLTLVFETGNASGIELSFFVKNSLTNPESTFTVLNYGDDSCYVEFNSIGILQQRDCTASMTEAKNGWRQITMRWPVVDGGPVRLYLAPPHPLQDEGIIIIDEASLAVKG